MTAFASAILAALPGAGVQPEKAGTGAPTADSVAGVFEGLLNEFAGDAVEGSLLDDARTASDVVKVSDGKTEGGIVDPSLAAASNVLPFMPLSPVVIPTQEEAASAVADALGSTSLETAATLEGDIVADAAVTDTTVEAPVSVEAEAATGTGTGKSDAADAATKIAESPVAATAAAPTDPKAQAQAAPSAGVPVADVVALAAPELMLAEDFPADVLQQASGESTPRAVADQVAAGAASGKADAAATDVNAALAKGADAVVANTAVKVTATAQDQAQTRAQTSTPALAVTTTADIQAAADADVVASGNAVATAEVTAEAAPLLVAVAGGQTRAAAPAAEARRTVAAVASESAKAGKSDESAVSAYLEGLKGEEEVTTTDASATDLAAQTDAVPDAVVLADSAAAEDPAGQAPGAEVRAAAASSAGQAAEAPAASKSSAETVAKLSADIVRKLEGQSTKFDLQLDPHGLGKVDVSVEINADGRLTANLTFDSAATASDLKGRSAELRAALEQAGFDVSDNGLSFDMASQNGSGFGGRETDEQPRAWSGRAFQQAQSSLDEADTLAALSSRSRAAAGGVDVRI